MKLSTEKIIIAAIVAILAGSVIYMALQSSPRFNKEIAMKEAGATEFGACLKGADVKFYGAFWCPHCQRMKKLLGEGAYAPIYQECSTPDGQGQTEACKNAKIEGYPTWEFKDGSRLSGEQTLTKLGEKSGCTVPASYGITAESVGTTSSPAK